LSLASIQRRTIAVSEARIAGEYAAPGERRGGVTIAEDRLVVDDQDVSEINILGAIDNTNALGEVVLGLFATVRPIIISILAKSSWAGERAGCIRGIGDHASGGEGNNTRDVGAIRANATATASVVSEGAVSTRVNGTFALINFATIGGRTVAIVVISGASVRAVTSGSVAKVVCTTLDDSNIQSRVSSKGEAGHGNASDIKQGSLALTRSEGGTAFSRRVLATVTGETVAVLEARHASNVASTNDSTSNSGRGAISGQDVLSSAEGCAVEPIVGSIRVPLSETASATSSGGANIGRKLAAVLNITVAVSEARSAIRGGLANTTRAADSTVDIRKR